MTRCSSSVWQRLSNVGWKERPLVVHHWSERHNTVFHVLLRVSRKRRLRLFFFKNTGANINDNMQRSGLAYFSNEANIPGDYDAFTLDAALPTEAPLQWFRPKELSYRAMSLRMDAHILWAVERRLQPPLQSESTGTRGGLDRQSDEVHSRFEILACDGGRGRGDKVEHLRLLSEPEQRSEALAGTGPVGFDFCEPNKRSKYLMARKEKKSSQKWRRTWLALWSHIIHDY